MLISLSDFGIRYMTQGVTAPRFDPFIDEAERMEIRDFLGDALYLALSNDVGNSPMDADLYNLLYGADYTYNSQTVHFDGIQMALQYYAYARYLANMETHTSVGLRNPQGEFSNLPDTKSIMMKIEQARSSGAKYLKDAERFLITNSSLYPTWSGREKKIQGGFKIRVT